MFNAKEKLHHFVIRFTTIFFNAIISFISQVIFSHARHFPLNVRTGIFLCCDRRLFSPHAWLFSLNVRAGISLRGDSELESASSQLFNFRRPEWQFKTSSVCLGTSLLEVSKILITKLVTFLMIKIFICTVNPQKNRARMSTYIEISSLWNLVQRNAITQKCIAVNCMYLYLFIFVLP